jgi:hypothetical protein
MIAAAEPLVPLPAPPEPSSAKMDRHPLREPLVWLVFGIPLLTVVAGLATLWIAFQRADSNVSEDYYKEGLGINRRIERDDLALAYRVDGQLTVGSGVIATGDGRHLPLDLVMTGVSDAFEAQVTLRMTHPVRQSLDRLVVLQAVGSGRYRGQLDADGLEKTRWLLAIETPAWRLALPGLRGIASGARLDFGKQAAQS